MQIPKYIYFLMFISISCNQNEKKIGEEKIMDTIKRPTNILIEQKNCLGQTNGFKNRYGIIFSNYYQDKPLSFDFDNNKTIDTIAILKPYYENSKDDCFPNNSEFDFPILLISKTINKKSKIFKIYKNALENNRGNYYEEIKNNKNGFIISKDLTGNNGFYTKTYVSFKNNDFYVDSIKVESWGANQYEKTLIYKTFKLSNYKRTDIDSLRTILDKS